MTEAEKLQKDLNGADANLVLMGVLHLFFAFFASLGYAIYFDYWKPFFIATIVGVASIVVSVFFAGMIGFVLGAAGGSEELVGLIGFIIGFLFGCIAPVVSFLMFRARVILLRDRVNRV